MRHAPRIVRSPSIVNPFTARCTSSALRSRADGRITHPRPYYYIEAILSRTRLGADATIQRMRDDVTRAPLRTQAETHRRTELVLDHLSDQPDFYHGTALRDGKPRSHVLPGT